MITIIVAFVIVIGILIFVHEFGHFFLAKLMGVGVEKFSLGFGPRIVGRKVGMTDYRISALPLGGFVKMVGEEPDAELDDSLIPLSFSHKSLVKRSLIVAAGPGFNLLLAVAIFFFFFLFSGMPVMEAEVGEVQEDMPALEAGVLSGDRVVSIDGKPVTRWDEMAGLIQESNGRTIGIEVVRDNRTILLKMTPRLVTSQNLFGDEIEKYAIGITASGAFRTERLNALQSAGQGVMQTWEISKLTVLILGKIIVGTISAKAIGGPIMIAQLAGQQAEAGMQSYILFMAFLSINLGLINLVPIPVLDGGHLMFFLIEAVTRRPVNLRVREVAQQIGVFVLILLMLFVFYNDIERILFN
ncbi:MAG: RIP metalloprotease RseP [Deltaproteobacteria bacterium]|jgi:regulator of sigma E protease